ncbi:hypothetical protein ACS3SW_09445 [Roseobacteraceae bacterium S113]
MPFWSTGNDGATGVDAYSETRLGTSGAKARYHALLHRPYSLPMGMEGYIVGIEKAHRRDVGFPGGALGHGHDSARLQPPHEMPGPGNPNDLGQQQRDFKRITDNTDVLFVSHIIRYTPAKDRPAIEPELAYSAYEETGFDKSTIRMAAGMQEDVSPYEAGWLALDKLEQSLLGDIAAAAERGTPFTHLVLMCMGWNNDQTEALERYNDLMMQTGRNTDGAVFNPLVIGLTWPSVWKTRGDGGFINWVLHKASYANKALDADELGFGIANALVNRILPRVEAASGLRAIMIGHSMGARILSRAYYSAQVLRDAVPRTGLRPILIGLQGAFSANRFRADFELVPVVRAVFTGEGGPYQDHDKPGGHVVLTWAKRDFANPVAAYVTGAAHVGGSVGAKAFDDAALAGKIVAYELEDHTSLTPPVQAVVENGRVLYIDASSIIGSHGDIRDAEVGRLTWVLIETFEMAEQGIARPVAGVDLA